MPSIPKSVEREVGHAGLSLAWGNELIDTLEETPELRWPESVKVYDRMRRTSGKVNQTFKAITLPIRRTPIRIDPNGARDEIVERLSENIGLPIDGEDEPIQPSRTRQRGRFSFKEHWRHALLSLIFGHMAFEQVYEIEGDGFARIRKLAPRMPHTISKIEVAPDGGLVLIKQNPQPITGRSRTTSSSLTQIDIGIDRLLWYAVDREAASWTGTSLLRTAYMHWMLQQRFYRVDALTKERNGMGVPTVERTDSAMTSEGDENKALEYAKSFRAGEFAGGYLPYGYRLRLLGVEGSLPDSLESAKHHGEQIGGSMMGEFLNLGHTEHGSRALGETFVDQFHLAIMTVLEDHLDVFNAHEIEDWVDINWGEDEVAPKLVGSDIGSEQAITAEALVQLIQVGAIKADRSIRAFIRQSFRLPKEDVEDETEPSGTTYQYDLDFQIVTIDERRAQIGLPPLPNDQGAVPPLPSALRVPEEAGGPLTAANARRKQLGLPPIDAATLKRWEGLKAAEGSTFRRELFDHEVKAATDFGALQGQWQDALDRLVGEFSDVRGRQLEELVDQITVLVDSGDVAALGAMSVSVTEAQEVIENFMLEAADKAADGAVAEATRQGQTIDKPMLDRSLISEHATRVAMLMGSDLASVAGRKAGENAAVGGVEAAKRAAEYIEGLSDIYLTDNLGGAITTAQNTGRIAVMGEAGPEELYASELLDDVTCENCADMDGKPYDSLEAAQEDYPTGGHFNCLGGTRCRGTIVAVYGESEATV